MRRRATRVERSNRIRLRIMASQVVLRHSYPQPPERMWEVLTDENYLRGKLRAVGGPGAELVSRETNEDGVIIVLHQLVPDDALPSFLRAVLPDDLTIRRTETSTSSGGSVEAVINGVPGEIAGSMQLEPDPAGSILAIQLTAQVRLPLFSGKAEKLIADNVSKLLTAEYHFTLEWLHN